MITGKEMADEAHPGGTEDPHPSPPLASNGKLLRQTSGAPQTTSDAPEDPGLLGLWRPQNTLSWKLTTNTHNWRIEMDDEEFVIEVANQ